MPDPSHSNARVHLVWCIAFITAVAAGCYVYKLTLDRAEKTVSATVTEAEKAVSAATAKAEAYARKLAATTEATAAKFKTGTITETFRAEIPVFEAAGIGRLDVGTANATETFSRSDTRKIGRDWLYMGTTVSTIHVPVTYRYHIDLGGKWDVSVADRTCRVCAPALEPSLPVAIRTEGMMKESTAGWSRFDSSQQLDALERTITPKLNEYARTPERVALAREQARLTVAKFIRAWLLREDQWRDDKITSVVVVFADENAKTDGEKPTLRIEQKP